MSELSLNSLKMKKIFLLLFVSFTLTSFTQTFYDFMIVDGLTDAFYSTIVENDNGDIYTVDRVNLAGTQDVNLVVTQYSEYGEFINRNISTSSVYSAHIEVALDMTFHNDSLLLFLTDSTFQVVSYKFSSDLSNYEKIYLDIDASPYRVEYFEDSIIIMCYEGDYSKPYKTTILTLDYNLNILDYETYNLDPWDFQISSGVIYFSCKDSNDDFSIRKIVDGDVVMVVDFGLDVVEYLVTQFEFLNDSMFVVSNRYNEYTLVDIYYTDGTYHSNVDTIVDSYNSFLKLNSMNGNVYMAWAEPYVGLYLDIIYSDLSVVNHELITSVDTSMRAHMLYATDEHIYIYGGWLYGSSNWNSDSNPLIVKTDEQGTFDMNVAIDESIINNSETLINVYPNPVEELLFVEILNESSNLVYIYDESGKMVYETSIKSSTTSQIDLSHLDGGVYFIKVNSSPYFHKVIKL